MSINYITNKIINLDNNIFSLNYDNSDKVDTIFKILFYSLANNSYKSKFIMFKETLNSFLSFSREKFIQYFCKIQKTYNALARFAFLYKYKKSVMSVTTDMGLNDININNKNVLCIYHIDSRYLFNINDLIKIINMALINNYMFFAEPLPSKNPYNNLPFLKSNLYNIYFFIKFNTNIYDDLFFKFFHCNFDLSLFYKKYEYLLREYAIINFIKNLTVSNCIGEINKMLHKYNYKNKNKIIINSEFPKTKLIQIMKPYLVLYLQSIYSLISIIKLKSGIELINKLRRFQAFNPHFGRKIIKLDFKIDSNFKKKVFIKCYEFNDKHIAFNDYNHRNFLKNQLSFNQININENDIEETDVEETDNEESDNEDDQIQNNPYNFIIGSFRLG
jgi:hypothetical protein